MRFPQLHEKISLLSWRKSSFSTCINRHCIKLIEVCFCFYTSFHHGIRAFTLEQYLSPRCVLCYQNGSQTTLHYTPYDSPNASVADDALFSSSFNPHKRLPFFFIDEKLLSSSSTPSPLAATIHCTFPPVVLQPLYRIVNNVAVLQLLYYAANIIALLQRSPSLQTTLQTASHYYSSFQSSL